MFSMCFPEFVSKCQDIKSKATDSLYQKQHGMEIKFYLKAIQGQFKDNVKQCSHKIYFVLWNDTSFSGGLDWGDDWEARDFLERGCDRVGNHDC